jgi:hypothetical protein
MAQDTTGGGITPVAGAIVAVVAFGGASADAGGSLANGGRAARVSVVTFRVVGREDASERLITSVVRAWISILAGKTIDPRVAPAIATTIPNGAHTPIIARQGVIADDAAGGRIATLAGAVVAVIAIRNAGTHAGPILAYG